MDKTIKPADRLRGEIAPPGDKSISHRVVFIGSISKGITVAKNFLKAEDTLNTVSAFSKMGIEIGIQDKKITIAGKGLRGLKSPDTELYLGNSGTTMRILPGILAGQNFKATLTGDKSLSKRPMKRIIEPLRKMGVQISAKNADIFPPLTIKGGKVKPVEYRTKVASAQIKSCILFAGLYANGITAVTEPFMSRDHTERMLGFHGVEVSREGLTVFIKGNTELEAREFFVPGDISSAAFFIAASSILEGSEVTIRDVGLNPTRMGFINILVRMGADIAVDAKKKNLPEAYGDIRVRYAPLKGAIVEKENIPLLIDEVPILCVVAAVAEGTTVIKGISELKVKETDRVFSITENLRGLGVDIKRKNEDIIITGGKKRFRKAALDSFGDHRIAMSMAVAGLRGEGEFLVKNTDCIGTSFPEFFQALDYLRK